MHQAAPDASTVAADVSPPVQSDQGGVIQTTVRAGNSSPQVITADQGSAIAGATVTFPPDSFDTDTNVVFSSGSSLATKANLTALIDANASAVSTGPAVEMVFAYDEDTLVPFTLQVPAPPAPSAKVTNSVLVVISVTNVTGKGTFSLTMTPASSLTVAPGLITMTGSAYGVFQAAYVSSAPQQTKTVPTQQKVSYTPPPATASPNLPGSFNITGPATDSADAWVPAHPTISWDAASDATSYDVTLDAADPHCGSPYKTYAGVTEVEVTGDPQDGPSFICVTAKNQYGSTKAANDGFKIMADGEAPPAPAKPTSPQGTVSTSLAVTFNWQAVTDTGGSGVQTFLVQIGTAPGAADIFNGPVVGTSQSILAPQNGQTFYCRVSAVDAAGNQSAWSPNSDGVLVNAN